MSSDTSLSTRSLAFLAWLEVNKTRLIVGAVLVAVVVSAFVIHRWRVAEREQAASSALIQAQNMARADLTGDRPESKAFLRIASEYRGTEAGQRALLFAAEALYLDGNYAESMTQFEAFREAQPLSPLAAIAAYGVAACLDAMGKTTEAFHAYQEVVTRYGNTAVASQARLAMADLYVAKGEVAQALRLYDDLRVTAWEREATQRREQLLVRHPELAETNGPPRIPEVTLPVLDTGLEIP